MTRLGPLILVLFLILASPIQGQTTTPAAKITPTPTPVAGSIALATLATQTDQAFSSLKETQDTLASNLKAAQSVEATLPTLSQDVQSKVSDNATLIQTAPSLYSLQRAEDALHNISDSLTLSQTKLTENARVASSTLEQMKDQAKLWTASLQSAKSAGAPPEMLGRVQAVIALVAQTSKLAQASQVEILAIQARLSDQNSIINGGLGDLTKAKDLARDQLFQQDHPPLWSYDAGEIKVNPVAQEHDSLQNQWGAVMAYLSQRPNTLYIHGMLWIFLLLGLSRIRSAIPAGVADEVVQMPIVMASLFALLASEWLYPVPPRLFSACLGAIIIIPTLIVLRRLMETGLVPILYAVVISYFVDHLRSILTLTALESRFAFAFELLACSIFLLWLLRSKRLSKLASGYGGALKAYCHISMLVLVFAGFANVFGYEHLSELLGNGMLTSGYLTMVFYAAVKIIDLLIMSCMRVPPLNKMRLFQFHRDVIYLKCCVIVRWSMTIGWIASTLKAFTIQDTIFSSLMAFLTTQVYWGSLSISLGPILEFGLTIWAAFLLSRFTRFILEEELYSHITLSRGLPYIFSTFVHYGILILGLFIAVEAVGIDLDKFALVGGTIGVGLGLAIQSPIGNFVAGVFLLVERPVRVGDSIQIETTGVSGTIEQIGMRKSILRMENGSQVIVPNSTLTSSSIVTWSSGSPHRLIELPVTASPKADLKRILELLVKAAESDARVLKTPPPQALLTSVGSSFSYKLRVWINAEEDQVAVLRELSIELGKALADEKVELG